MKSLKLLLKTLSIAALLAFANNGLVIAADAANAQAEAAAEPVAKKEKDKKNKKSKGKKKNKKNKKDARPEEDVDDDNEDNEEERDAKRWASDENSFFNRYEKAKLADATSVAARALNEIGLIVDDSDRRYELYKYLRANEGKELSEQDLTMIKQLGRNEILSMNSERIQVREVVDAMPEKIEDELEELFFEPKGKERAARGKQRAPKRKAQAGVKADANDDDDDRPAKKDKKKKGKKAGKGQKKK